MGIVDHLAELHDTVHEPVFISILGGEPTEHADLARVTQRLKERGFVVNITTNGLELLRMYREGRSLKHIAAKLGFPDSLTVSAHVQEASRGAMHEVNQADMLNLLERLAAQGIAVVVADMIDPWHLGWQQQAERILVLAQECSRRGVFLSFQSPSMG